MSTFLLSNLAAVYASGIPSAAYVIIYCSNLRVYMEYGRLLREQGATRNAWAY